MLILLDLRQKVCYNPVRFWFGGKLFTEVSVSHQKHPLESRLSEGLVKTVPRHKGIKTSSSLCSTERYFVKTVPRHKGIKTYELTRAIPPFFCKDSAPT